MRPVRVDNSPSFRINALIFALCCFVFISAHALVLIKHYGRVEVMRAQGLRHQYDAMKSEWYGLQMERSKLATHSRVQSIAERERNMSVPQKTRTRMVVVDESDL